MISGLHSCILNRFLSVGHHLDLVIGLTALLNLEITDPTIFLLNFPTDFKGTHFHILLVVTAAVLWRVAVLKVET